MEAFLEQFPAYNDHVVTVYLEMFFRKKPTLPYGNQLVEQGFSRRPRNGMKIPWRVGNIGPGILLDWAGFYSINATLSRYAFPVVVTQALVKQAHKCFRDGAETILYTSNSYEMGLDTSLSDFLWRFPLYETSKLRRAYLEAFFAKPIEAPSAQVLKAHGFSWTPRLRMNTPRKVRDISHVLRLAGFYAIASRFTEQCFPEEAVQMFLEHAYKFFPNGEDTILYTTAFIGYGNEESSDSEGDVEDPKRKMPYFTSSHATGSRLIGRFDPAEDTVLDEYVEDCCRSCYGLPDYHRYQDHVKATTKKLQIRRFRRFMGDGSSGILDRLSALGEWIYAKLPNLWSSHVWTTPEEQKYRAKLAVVY
jgi:hypothetical protein